MSEIILSRAKPLDSALKFLATERPNLIRQQREWLDYDGHAYISVEDDTITAELAAWANTAKVQILGSFEQFVGQNDRLFPPSSVLRKVGMDI
jgi:hypothetical protein